MESNFQVELSQSSTVPVKDVRDSRIVSETIYFKGNFLKFYFGTGTDTELQVPVPVSIVFRTGAKIPKK